MAQTTRCKHVAVLAFPFASHSSILFGLCRRLATRAPTITFSFHCTSKQNRLLFSTHAPPVNVRPFDVPDGLPKEGMFSGNLLDEIYMFLESGEEGLKASMAAAEEEIGLPIKCVVSDAFLWFASAGLAENMGATWIALWISGAGGLSTHVYTDLIRETLGFADISGRENEILKFIPGFPELPLGDLPDGIVFGDLQSPFSVMLHKMGQVLHKADAVILHSYEELEPEHNKDLALRFRNILNIGSCNLSSPPQTLDDPYGCIQWLDKHKLCSVAYLAFGIAATPPPHELVAIAEALEATRTPFLWSLRDKSKEVFSQGLLEKIGKFGKIVHWAPQVNVLEHGSIGVFVTHFGWNSVIESIVAGVPLIGRPLLGDHRVIAWRVEKVWKIGVRVEGGTFTKNGMISALEVVLKTEEGKKLKEQSEMYKEVALKAVGSQGSSTRSFNTLVEIVTGSKFEESDENVEKGGDTY